MTFIQNHRKDDRQSFKHGMIEGSILVQRAVHG